MTKLERDGYYLYGSLTAVLEIFDADDDMERAHNNLLRQIRRIVSDFEKCGDDEE